MRFVSLFSGVGGFDLGLEAAGMTCVAQVEWDADCQAVLAHHWPNVPRWSDVADVNGADLPPAELVAFGSPCQDLSVAGKRAGFDGTRSVLFYQATRIIREMRAATDGQYPTFAVWENVAGALSSSGGRDFAAVLDDLADLGAVDICWRVLDARWHGVPQRRRRIFLVADLAGERAGAVLPESPSVSWHPDPRLAPWAHTARGAQGSARGGRSRLTADEGVVTALTAMDGVERPDLAHAQAGWLVARMQSFGQYAVDDTASALKARDYKDATDLVAVLVGDGERRPGQVVGFADKALDLVGQQSVDLGDKLVAAEAVADDGHGDGSHAEHPGCRHGDVKAQVRRLTPTECERLMGWPDDHTRWRPDGTEVPDSTRYRMCGNGVAAPVAQWLGERIMQAAS